ncbi:MAG: hypothetical protein IT327_32360 [Anaerolineae bacterium]|nr:hypothetical protein [Anaerolineae bacterium]
MNQPMDDLQTIDLTLRITCEPADAARFPLSAATMRATCRAVAEALALNGRFYVALLAVSWPASSQLDEAEPAPS